MYWQLTGQSSLSENFLAGSMELAVTVVLIDGLLLLERRQRIKILNQGHANSSTFNVGLYIVSLMREFNFGVKPSELEVVGMSNSDLRAKVDEFFGSDEYRQYLQNIKTAKNGTLKQLKKLGKLIEESGRSIRENLEKTKPYPDPSLIKLVSDPQPAILAVIKVVEVIYESLKIISNAKGASDASLAKRIMDQELERITNRQDSIDDRINLHDAIKTYMEALLNIHERAEKNRLHYDV